MPSALVSPLAEVAAEAFAHLAFLFVEPQEATSVVATDADAVAVVSFTGPLTGAVLMQVSRGVLPQVAAAMLGVDETPNGEAQRDALGELANIVAGNLLPRVAGTRAVFTLAAPTRWVSWSAACERFGVPAAHVGLAVEGGHADVAVVLR
jgi:CheY-specific phosphatase CheX